jgi:cyclic beta-1,2-glucan synthetase
MGWERKRGKLHELNRLILTAANHPPTEIPEALENNGFCEYGGKIAVLANIKYVITLDADTVLPRGSAKRMIGAMAHPLNRTEYSSEDGAPQNQVVTAGYEILQPRTEISPTRANQSLFTRIFAGDGGLDLYTLAVSDVYQDFFGDGIYIGKGIYEVSAFERGLEGRVPENTLLSHDLFEGIHGRVALATDIVLIEDYPPNYLVQIRRVHRWVRGDWQLLPWLLPRLPSRSGKRVKNYLSVIDRWKIVDNLRRSLLAPLLFLIFITGWLILPGPPLVWMLIAALTLAMPIFTGFASTMNRVVTGAPIATAFHNAWQSAREGIIRWLLALAFLPFESLLTLDAILTTLLRVYITHKHMLSWTTMAHSSQLLMEKHPSRIAWREMVGSFILVLGLVTLILWVNPSVMFEAAPLLLMWLLSPEIASWISRPIIHQGVPLTEDQNQSLHLLARRTWLFFEQFIGPEDHWLPPDHFQETPLGVVAHRTSPTNIGLALLSTFSAYDLGYISLLDLTVRLRTTLEEMESMEQYRGHLLNWYDTRNLNPLPPRYVSTVDSGNLAACLITLEQSCLVIQDAPVLRWETCQGLLDTIGLLVDLIDSLKDTGAEPASQPLRDYLLGMQREILAVKDQPRAWASTIKRLSGDDRADNRGQSQDKADRQQYFKMAEQNRLLMAFVESSAPDLGTENLNKLRIYSRSLRHHLENALREIDMLLPWIPELDQPPKLFKRPDIDPAIREAFERLLDAFPAAPALSKIDEICRSGLSRLSILLKRLDHTPMEFPEQVEQARAWCSNLAETLASARMSAKVVLIGYQDLSRQADAWVRKMDFSFLYDRKRQVFHIGYNVASGTLDSNYYDLLASEARTTSLVAISMGEIPQSHWMHLGRPLTRVNGTRVLLSWSATMFEYLMPALLLRNFDGTLLDMTLEAVIDYQITYGKRKKLPWGISESGYYRFDANLFYQYRAFGVPGLGYKRGLSEDLVITPYASLLALVQRPQAVASNLNDLVSLQMLGTYGFYEAVDFTPSRLPLGSDHEIVYSYMAHHQGMILLSLDNYFNKDVMVKRFHTDPRIQTVELLLQEQIPQNAPLEQLNAEEGRSIRPVSAGVVVSPWRVPVNLPQPRVHFLTNGHYGLLITSAGGGYSTWQDIDLTRWRADTTLNNWGTWIYIQDKDSGHLWSAGYQPTGVHTLDRDVYFNAHMVEFRRQDHGISIYMDITISPEDDVEIRRISLSNHTNQTRHISLTSYAEIVLASQTADQRHPAFNKLFIESEYLSELNALLFRRRPRSQTEKPVFLIHALLTGHGIDVTGAHETDRARFIGRLKTARSPAVFEEGGALSGSTGATLDPIYSLSQEVTLEPNSTKKLAFITLASHSRQAVIDLADRYRSWRLIEHAFYQAQTRAEIELRQLGLTADQVEHIQKLLSVLFFPHPALRAAPELLAANQKGQSGLWAYSISGDYPILLVRVSNQDELTLVHELLQAHAYWRERQIKIDMVLLNTQGTDYGQELNVQLHRLITHMNADAWLNRRGGIFLLIADQMGKMDLILLETTARAILDGEKGSLADQLIGMHQLPPRLPAFNPTLSGDQEPTAELPRPADLQFDNGLGGFSPDGSEYVIYLQPGRSTPLPWVNVIANEQFGFLVSEAGSSCTWAVNSGENRLTPWNNDPVSDIPGEALYLRDEETGRFWSPMPLPAPDSNAYLIRHGAGYSIFEHYSHGLNQRVRLFAIQDAPVKVIQVRLENTWSRPRRVTATYYAEWVLGVNREWTQQYVIPEFDAPHQALLARNPYNAEFGDRLAFLTSNKMIHGLTADRTEFLGRMGGLKKPAALGRVGLASMVRAGLDPCGALQVHIDLPPQGTEEFYFLLGEGEDREDTFNWIEKYRDETQIEIAWKATRKFWDEILGKVQVQTPDPGMNLVLNRWLLYQALSCRIWGRTAFYQSSGAYGFRDQLQDVMALVWAEPQITRKHILKAARHQFEAGDVLHWWHPPSGRGVRTRISDDLLWLPYVTALYVHTTGDYSILNEMVPFQKGPELQPDEEERYDHYQQTDQEFSLYEHCLRALDKGSSFGPHKLPLMGSGDWNDGMNRVGIEGRGESIWLGWFLTAALDGFEGLCEQRGDHERAAAYRARAADLSGALEKHAWDGEWYLRAYYDDGSPLGSAQNRECQIDSIAQSWGVISGAADPKRAVQSMRSVSERLVRPDDDLILLFTPPLDQTHRDPGYIKGYLPGIRENGGQYTHAATWAVWAFAQLGQGDTAEELYRLLNPIYHTDTPEKAARYKVEPYVIAADVYSLPPHTGRGGWTWYTGSSGWMYRLGIDAILGLHQEGDWLVIDPCIPKEWPGFKIHYRSKETTFEIEVDNSAGVNRGVKKVHMDRKPLPDGKIPLVNDGRSHQVKILLG